MLSNFGHLSGSVCVVKNTCCKTILLFKSCSFYLLNLFQVQPPLCILAATAHVQVPVISCHRLCY